MLVTTNSGRQEEADQVLMGEAYNMGRKARLDGKALDCNPWPDHYEQRFHWLDGWGDTDASLKRYSR